MTRTASRRTSWAVARIESALASDASSWIGSAALPCRVRGDEGRLGYATRVRIPLGARWSASCANRGSMKSHAYPVFAGKLLTHKSVGLVTATESKPDSPRLGQFVTAARKLSQELRLLHPTGTSSVNHSGCACGGRSNGSTDASTVCRCVVASRGARPL